MMKTLKKLTRTWLIQITVMVSLVLFAVNLQAANFKVNMKVSSDGSALDITSDMPADQRCSANLVPPPVKGCMRVKDRPLFRTAHMTFGLPDSVACGANGRGTWKLREVYLGGQDKSVKPGASYNWGDLSPEVQADFDVNNPVSGLLNNASQGKKNLKIKNKNKSKYTIWYKVVAKCMDGNNEIGGSIETDPRIENEGKPN